MADPSLRVNKCFEYKIEGYQYIILLAAMPFQSLLIKVLVKDLGFKMPRHIIMFSMSMSDLIQPLFICICYFIVSVSKSGAETTLCFAMRETILFIGMLTTVLSSLGVIAMSIERYIACIHSFHIHRIFTHERVVCGSIIQWVVAMLLAITEVLTNKANKSAWMSGVSALQIIFIIFTFAAAIPVCIIQVRLFFFAKTKLKRVNPAGAFGAQLELADYRKKQLKVALVSGIVAIGYVVCMLPTAYLFLYEIITGTTASTFAKQLSFAFTTGNCLIEPLIYGLGNADTRKMIMQNLKKAKGFMMIKLFPTKVEPGVFTV